MIQFSLDLREDDFSRRSMSRLVMNLTMGKAGLGEPLLGKLLPVLRGPEGRQVLVSHRQGSYYRC